LVDVEDGFEVVLVELGLEDGLDLGEFEVFGSGVGRGLVVGW
jgi:hypothetical protein